LGGCEPQLPLSELYITPTFSYNPTSTNILDYTYGCPPGIYSVQLIASNLGYCSDTTTLNISIIPDVLAYVPNTFTPDDDENNNNFYPIFSSPISSKDYVFRIFNRWGEIVFETNEVPPFPTPLNASGGFAWDGTSEINSKTKQDGTYTWIIEYRTSFNDDKKEKIGHVNLLR
jgi:hypothetical protein